LLSCSVCGKRFEKLDKEYRRQVKNGRDSNDFACSLSCGSKKRNAKRLKAASPKDSRYTLSSEALKDKDLISYFLGFCYADGSYSKTRDTLTWYSTDLQILEDLNKAFGYSREVRVSKLPRQPNHKLFFSNRFYAKNARLFCDMGLKPNKKSIFWEDLSVDIFSFMRGIIDGDGTVAIDHKDGRVRYISVLGQPNLLRGLSEDLNARGFRCSLYSSKSDVSIVQVWKQSSIPLLEEMYKNPESVRLNRKYEKVKEFLV